MASLFRVRQSFLQNVAWQSAALNGLHYNTSVQGAVIQLIYGTTRVQTNLLDFGDYRGPKGSKGKTGALPVSGTQSRSAKGGSSKSGKKSSPNYTVDVAFGIGQGPISGIGQVYTSAGVAPFSSLPLNFYDGSDGQVGDPTFTSLGDYVNYSGTSFITGTPLDLGPSPVLPNIGVEAIGILVGTNTGGYTADANPANVIKDFLTNSRYGAQFPSVNLDDLTTLTGTSLAEYCQATPFLISVTLDGHQKAIEWVDSLCRLIHSAMFFSGKLLKIIPYGDLALSNNSATWTPNLVPAYALTDDNFLPWRQHEMGREPSPGEDDPILVTRSNHADADNQELIEYTARNNFYNSTTLMVDDQGAIDTYGLRIGDSIPGRAFCESTFAQLSAQMTLQRKQFIRNTPYKIQAGWQYARVEPMDIITLTGRYADLYLQAQPVRVLSIEEDDAGGLTIEAEEIQQGVSAPMSTVCIPPAIDAAVAGAVGTRTAPDIYPPVNTLTLALSTSFPQEVVIFAACASSYVMSPATLNAPTSGGLTWTPLGAAVSFDGKECPGSACGTTHFTARAWWAPAASILSSENITVTTSPDATGIAAAVVSVNGAANYLSPFNAALVSDEYHSISAPVPTQLTVTGLTTTSPHGLMLGILADLNAWTTIGGVINGWTSTFGGGGIRVAAAYAALGDFYPSIGIYYCPVCSTQAPAPVGSLQSFLPYGWISFGTSIKAD